MLKKSIYKIENLNNGKVYIGQSIHPHRRLIEHMYMARHHLDDLPIHLAIAKYKEEAFSFAILEEDVENYNERDILNLVNDFKNNNIPLSVIMLVQVDKALQY